MRDSLPVRGLIGLARWMGLTTEDASHLLLSTPSLSIAGYEHTLDDSAIVLWNDDHQVKPGA